MTGIAFALTASLSWGFADFLAGLKSRSLPVLAVLVVSQPAGLAVVAVLVAVRGAPAPDARHALYAALGGWAGIVGLAAFYRGLSVGAMSVVAPLSATAALVPLAVGLATGERPSSLQGAGVALALVGVVLASREAEVEARRGNRMAAGVGLALIAALGFGLLFVAVDAATAGGADVLWVTFLLRSASLTLVLAAALAVRPRLPRHPRTLAVLLLVGVLDMSANALFAAASTRGLVSVVAVLASLYPVVVVLLARVVLNERIARAQQAGVALALAGVALISAG
ncbi:MAG TPA: EamA family transporter [Candidatus Limnocylindrales bacterium]|nr:EamA family transporter [Candidatus Limnocylindrales bacterium]